MLGFDMPLEKLYDYKGRNPKPDDFDDYWEKGLEEMRTLKPRVELKPAWFQTKFAECMDMYFTGVGGARVHAKLVRPRKKSAKRQPALLLFHGYSGHSGDWLDKLPYAAMGFTVAALDCRGQGGQSEDIGGVPGNTLKGHIIRGLDGRPDQLLFRQIFLDTAQLASLIMNMPGVDPERVAATGGSQGGGLTLACAALEPRIRRIAPLFPFLCDYQRVWELELAKDAYQELKDYFRLFDPRHEREADVFTRLGYIDVQHLAPRIRARVMMAVGLSDTVCPPSTQFAAYNKIQSEKSLVLYPDHAHEALPGMQDRIFQFIQEL